MLTFTNIHFLLCKNFKGEILNIPIFKGFTLNINLSPNINKLKLTSLYIVSKYRTILYAGLGSISIISAYIICIFSHCMAQTSAKVFHQKDDKVFSYI